MSFADLNLSKRIRRCQEFSAPYRITDGKKFKLKDIDPGDIGDLESEDKPVAKEVLALGVETLAELQQRLYADDRTPSTLRLTMSCTTSGRVTSP
jgi:hypothetical protein